MHLYLEIQTTFQVKWSTVNSQTKGDEGTKTKNSGNSSNGFLALAIIWKQSDLAYVPDITFKMEIPAINMDDADLFKLRVESLEIKYDQAKKEINELKKQLSQAKHSSVYRDCVYASNNTGMISTGGSRTLARLVIPPLEDKRKYKFVVRYSAQLYANSNNNYWVYYGLYFNNQLKMPYGSGNYFFQYCNNYPFPVSQSMAIEINNTDGTQSQIYQSDDSRALEFRINPSQTYPCGACNVCIECYEV